VIDGRNNRTISHGGLLAAVDIGRAIYPAIGAAVE
jgi:hypothetical protein